MDVPPDVSNKILALNITLTKKLSKSQKKKKKKKKKNLFKLICITENQTKIIYQLECAHIKS